MFSPCVDHVGSRQTCSLCSCSGVNFMSDTLPLPLFSHSFFAADVVICNRAKQTESDLTSIKANEVFSFKFHESINQFWDELSSRWGESTSGLIFNDFRK